MKLAGLVKATLASIAAAGGGQGKLETMFGKCLRKVVENMTDLPGDDTTRKITIELEFKPSGKTGSVDSVEVGFGVKYKLAGEYGVMHMVPRGNDELLFNTDLLNNPREKSLMQADDGD